MGRQIAFIFLDREAKSISPMAGFDSSNIYNSIEQNLVPGLVAEPYTPREMIPALHDVNVAMNVLWNSTTDEQHMAFIGEDVQVICSVYDPVHMRLLSEPALLRNNKEVLAWQREHGIRYPKEIPYID